MVDSDGMTGSQSSSSRVDTDGGTSLTVLPFFDSFCNDKFSPVVISQTLQQDSAASQVLASLRIRVEPIGRLAGTVEGRFNQREIYRLLSAIEATEAVDLRLWRAIFPRFLIPKQDVADCLRHLSPEEHATTAMIAFDLDFDPAPKVYLYPSGVGRTQKHTQEVLSSEAVTILGVDIRTPLALFDDFYDHHTARYGDVLRLERISFDIKRPEDSSIVVYYRTLQTSLDHVLEIYRLGGVLTSSEIDNGCELVAAAWQFILREENSSAELPFNDHRTAGMLFSFEMRTEDAWPRPKVHIPVRHYCKSDASIAEGLKDMLGTMGLAWSDFSTTYLSTLTQAL